MVAILIAGRRRRTPGNVSAACQLFQPFSSVKSQFFFLLRPLVLINKQNTCHIYIGIYFIGAGCVINVAKVSVFDAC